MSDCFEPPPRAPEPEPRRYRYRTRPWLGARSGTLPGVVACERVLARTEQVAVCLGRVSAYPTGFGSTSSR